MLLQQIVETSRRIGETSKRTAKIGARRRPPAAPVAGGSDPGSLISLWSPRDKERSASAIRRCETPLVPQRSGSTLTVLELDHFLDTFPTLKSTRDKQEFLQSLLSRATESEQRFLSHC